jgi:acetyltransferase-like isoleucine patch superfamily enzyme
MIDSAAIIGETAIIGTGTRVWAAASIIRGACIGRDCNIGSCAIVDGAVIGDECLIGHGAQIHPGARLGNKVFVGPGAILCNDRWPRADKDGFDADPMIAREFISIEITDCVSIGARAVVLPGITIGFGAMIAAGAVVDKNVPEKYLLKRNGEIVPIDFARTPQRMRRAA